MTYLPSLLSESLCRLCMGKAPSLDERTLLHAFQIETITYRKLQCHFFVLRGKRCSHIWQFAGHCSIGTAHQMHQEGPRQSTFLRSTQPLGKDTFVQPSTSSSTPIPEGTFARTSIARNVLAMRSFSPTPCEYSPSIRISLSLGVSFLLCVPATW